ncbi:MAG: PAS domain-containing sensor histidine kinase [Verrucomicrobiales bacterium]
MSLLPSHLEPSPDVCSSNEIPLDSVLDDLPVGVIITNTEGKPLKWNRRYIELRGLDPEASEWLKCLHPEDRERVVVSWKIAAAEGNNWEEVYRFVHPDGKVVWVSGRSRALTHNGKMAGHVRTLEDITSLKAAEQTLRELNEALQRNAGLLEEAVQARTEKMQQAFAELDSLSYSIVHDMRAPLRAMRGFSDLLLESYEDKLDATGKDFLQRIAAAAKKQDDLISGVLAYHSYVRDKFPLSPVSLDEVVGGILSTYANLQPPKAQVTLEKPLGWVFGHETLLMQTMSALLNNASKFVAPGTKPAIRIWSETKENNVKIYVQDNGIGIAPEYHQRIFNVFQTLHDPQTYPGTGVGLPLAKKAVQRMDGQIGVESSVGKGSTFWIELKAI